LLLESAFFLPSAVRRTSRELGLISDSSYRFERGIDPAAAARAAARAVALVLELAGGEAEQGESVAGENRIDPVRVPLRYARCAALIGDAVTPAEVDRVLEGFGLRKVGGEGDSQEWEIPSHRADLLREVDLIEEVARARRIDQLPPGRARRVAAVSGPDRAYDFRLGMARRLAALGFSEARTMSLVAPATLALDPTGSEAAPVLRNPLSEDYSRLRPSLIPGLLRIASANARQGIGRIRLFEIGRVFGGEFGEETRLAWVMTGAVGPASWRSARPAESDFHDLKGVLEAVVSAALPDAELGFERYEDAAMALAVRVTLGGTALGRLVQVLPSVARALDVSGALLAGEIALDPLQPAAGEALGFRPPDRFPAVVRDMAVLVPRELPHARMLAAIRGAGEPLLAGVAVFDVFEDPSGEKIPRDRKSVAYTLTYRSPERTLTVEEANAAHARVKDAVAGATGAAFRE
jgi:phenylalanyl-tRNA synthetase beta chain